MYPVWTDDCDDWRHHIQANPGRLVMGRKCSRGVRRKDGGVKLDYHLFNLQHFCLPAKYIMKSWYLGEASICCWNQTLEVQCNCELWWLNCMILTKVTKGVFFTHHHPGQDCHQYHAVWPSIGYCEVDIIWWHRQSPGAETKATGGGGGQRDWAGSLRPTLYIVKDTLLAHWDQTIVYNKNMLF